MSGSFIDSNVLVYVMDKDDLRHETATALVHHLLDKRTGVVSFQVVQECMSVLRHKLKPPVPSHEVAKFAQMILTPMWRVMPSDALYQQTLNIGDRYGFHFYDALVVAAALEAGCVKIYSEDLQHGQKIQSLTIINPFR